MHRFVDELPARRRAVRLAAHEVRRRRVGRHGGDREDEVAEGVVGLEATAGPHTQQPCHAELDQLLEHDRRTRAAHASALYRDALPVPGARVPEEPTLLVDLGDVVQERLGDVPGPERVAGEEAGVRVVAGLGAKVDRHARKPTDPGRPVRAEPSLEFLGVLARVIEPKRDQILRFCAGDPVERVFLEDVARRGLGRFVARAEDGELSALCHLGINAVPSGAECGSFARDVARSGPRMLIGEQRAVSDLWDEVRTRLPKPREDRLGQPVYVTREPPPAGDTGLRPAQLSDLDLLMPACAEAHEQEIGVDPMKRDPDGFRWRTRSQIEDERSWLWVEDGVILFKAEASAWTPAAVQLQQVWVDPAVRRRGYGARGLADLCRLLLERVPTVCLFVRAENDPAIRLYEAVGMQHVLDYRSLLF